MTVYTPEIADIICARIAQGMTVKQAIKGVGYPTMPEFYAWLRESEEFRRNYETARQCKAESIVDEILEIADDSSRDYVTRTREDGSTYEEFNHEHVQRARVRIDSRKWIASKFYPRLYGEKSSVEHTGTVTLAQLIEESLKLPEERPVEQVDAGSGPRRH